MIRDHVRDLFINGGVDDAARTLAFVFKLMWRKSLVEQ